MRRSRHLSRLPGISGRGAQHARTQERASASTYHAIFRGLPEIKLRKLKETNKYKKQEEEKFDIEKWIKQHQNIEQPKRGKKNSLGDKKNKRRH